MTLRGRTLLTTSLILLVLIVSVLVAAQLTILPSVLRSERLETERDVQRVLAAYADRLAAMETNVTDWANWDDAYAFVDNANADFIASNLVDQTFGNLRLNSIVFVNNAGQVVYNGLYDLDTLTAQAPSAALLAQLRPSGPLFAQASGGDTVRGVLDLPEGMLMFVAHSILTSERRGPSRGLLLMGRFLDAAEVSHLQTLTLLQVSVQSLTAAAAASNAPCGLPAPAAPTLVCTLDDQTIAGYGLVRDALGQPALILQVTEPRTTYAQGQLGLRYFVIGLLLAGFVLTAAVLWQLERQVLSPVSHTSAEVQRIGLHGNITARVSPGVNDELGMLRESINRMLDGLQERAEEQVTLHTLAVELSAIRELDLLYRKIVQQAAHLLKSPGAQLYLCEPAERRLRCEAALKGSAKLRGAALAYGEGAAGTVALTGEPLLVEEYAGWRGRALMPEATAPHTALVSVPLVWQGSVQGVLSVLSNRRTFTVDDQNLLRLLADQAAIVIENTRLFAQVERLAITDELTGLSNRRQLFTVAEREFRRARRYSQTLSLFIIDLDHFKRINDTYGHLVGDQVLRGVAELFRQTTREVDLVGRYGGEEFMIVLPDTGHDEAQQVAERLRLLVSEHPIAVGLQTITLHVSIGIATLTSSTLDLQSLVEQADRAVYAAKHEGRNRTVAAVENRPLAALNPAAAV